MKKLNGYFRAEIIIVILLLICVLPFLSTFARYAQTIVKEYFFRSREFYFYSDKLDENGTKFKIDNWSGIDDYYITINMNSKKNNILGSTYDIPYNIKYTKSSNAICELSKTRGNVSALSNSDVFTLKITPNGTLNTGDQVEVDVEVNSDSYYNKTLRGKFILEVGKENITYKIEDEPGSLYCVLTVTNTKSTYIVDEAFDNYSINDPISGDIYLSLSDEKKAKCHSARIKLSFDPNVIYLDMTNSNYLNRNTEHTSRINGSTYINEFSFDLESISSTSVRFYKKNVDSDYSYPGTATRPIVNFESD